MQCSAMGFCTFTNKDDNSFVFPVVSTQCTATWRQKQPHKWLGSATVFCVSCTSSSLNSDTSQLTFFAQNTRPCFETTQNNCQILSYKSRPYVFLDTRRNADHTVFWVIKAFPEWVLPKISYWIVDTLPCYRTFQSREHWFWFIVWM
jgi:hypothetical protein